MLEKIKTIWRFISDLISVVAILKQPPLTQDGKLDAYTRIKIKLTLLKHIKVTLHQIDVPVIKFINTNNNRNLILGTIASLQDYKLLASCLG